MNTRMESPGSPELVVYQNNLLREALVVCLPLQMLSGDNSGLETVKTKRLSNVKT